MTLEGCQRRKGPQTDRTVKEGVLQEVDLLLDPEKRISFCKSKREIQGFQKGKISNLEAVFLKLVICISCFYDILLFA